MLEDHDGLLSDAGQAAQARRVHALLGAFDALLADLLAEHGLQALPATRLGVALCTRAGFRLGDCLHIWDALLADPLSFEFSHCVVVALLLLSRHELLQLRGDAGGLAEALLAAPRRVGVSTLLRVARAVCAFERRCGEGSAHPFPQCSISTISGLHSGNAVDKASKLAFGIAPPSLSSLWDKVWARATTWTSSDDFGCVTPASSRSLEALITPGRVMDIDGKAVSVATATEGSNLT